MLEIAGGTEKTEKHVRVGDVVCRLIRGEYRQGFVFKLE